MLHPNMTEELLNGTLNFKTKQTINGNYVLIQTTPENLSTCDFHQYLMLFSSQNESTKYLSLLNKEDTKKQMFLFQTGIKGACV